MTAMGMVWASVAGVVLGGFGSPVAAADAPGTVLPQPWRGDAGTPVAWNGTHVWLFDDVFDRIGPDMMPAADSQIHRNAVVVDGEMIVDPLPELVGGGYWWQDGIEMPDGSLFVLATEFRDRWDLAPPMQFEVVDTDAFVVRRPDSAKSWRTATKIEDGPWGDDSVQFLDQYPMVVARDPWAGLTGARTRLFEYSPSDPTVWRYVDSELPDSGAVVVPVRTQAGWWALSWGLAAAGELDWHTVTLWYAGDLHGSWVAVGDWSTKLRTHYHTLVMVDEAVWWRSNNLDGSRRPEYERVDL